MPGDLQYKDRDAVELMDELIDAEDVYAVILYNDEVSFYNYTGIYIMPNIMALHQKQGNDFKIALKYIFLAYKLFK